MDWLTAYPSWSYFPSNTHAPSWAQDLVAVVAAVEDNISSARPDSTASSDHVLARLAPGLQQLGFTVESGKKADQKIRRPVLFGENGVPTVSYEVDAVHEALGVVVKSKRGEAPAATPPTET